MNKPFIGEVVSFFLVLMLFLVFATVGHAQADSTVLPTLRGRPAIVDLHPTTIGEFEPPPIYAKWWKETMKCTGLYISTAQTKKVHWFYIDAQAFTIWGNDDYPFLGYTFAWDNKIVLILWHMETPVLVKHEMTHYLMWRNGVGFGHPSQYYDKCHYYTRIP